MIYFLNWFFIHGYLYAIVKHLFCKRVHSKYKKEQLGLLYHLIYGGKTAHRSLLAHSCSGENEKLLQRL